MRSKGLKYKTIIADCEVPHQRPDNPEAQTILNKRQLKFFGKNRNLIGIGSKFPKSVKIGTSKGEASAEKMEGRKVNETAGTDNQDNMSVDASIVSKRSND